MAVKHFLASPCTLTSFIIFSVIIYYITSTVHTRPLIQMKGSVLSHGLAGRGEFNVIHTVCNKLTDYTVFNQTNCIHIYKYLFVSL